MELAISTVILDWILSTLDAPFLVAHLVSMAASSELLLFDLVPSTLKFCCGEPQSRVWGVQTDRRGPDDEMGDGVGVSSPSTNHAVAGARLEGQLGGAEAWRSEEDIGCETGIGWCPGADRGSGPASPLHAGRTLVRVCNVGIGCRGVFCGRAPRQPCAHAPRAHRSRHPAGRGCACRGQRTWAGPWRRGGGACFAAKLRNLRGKTW